MNKIFEYLKLIIFVGGVLVGIQAPGFVDQYGKSLESRVSESKLSVSEFQDDSDKYFNGDLDKLIDHYDKNDDPVIISGGESIGAIVSRNRYLTLALNEFSQSIYSAYHQVIFNPVAEVRNDVWDNYTYSIILNGSAITIGLVVGLLFLIALELFIHTLKVVSRRFAKSKNETPKTTSLP